MLSPVLLEAAVPGVAAIGAGLAAIGAGIGIGQMVKVQQKLSLASLKLPEISVRS